MRLSGLPRLLLPLLTLSLFCFSCPVRAADDKQIRALLDAKITFPTYVFADDRFPEPKVNPASAVEEAIGPFTLKTTIYDREYKIVTVPEKAGPYAVIVEIVPKTGTPVRRFITLYRTAEKIADDTRLLSADPSAMARSLGLAVAAIKREEKLINEVLKGRSFAEAARDPRVARLFAGLVRNRADAAEVHKYDDAFAAERQWWVGLKRQRSGLDKAFPKAFTGPSVMDGKPATVVHEGTAAEAGMKADTAEKIDAALKEFAADTDQAFAVCIVRHGVIVLHRAYGIRDDKLMTVDTKSWMASITKTMSASLMMMLVDQGIVSLDDPVEKFVPALQGIKVEKPLLIRHLYTHTSGLAAWPAELYADELPDIEERVALVYPHLEVGKTWAYNGQGYTLGGKVIEAVSGEAIPQFYQKHLLGPLGCTGTDVTGTHADSYSIPLDIAKFGQMLLNHGAYGKYRFFKAGTFQAMLPRQLTTELGPEATKMFGIGLDGSAEKFGHGAASAATFHVDTTEDLVVVMTRNKMGKNQDKYNGKFWDAIRGGIEKGK